jgi:kynurenine formamidase/cyclophilin family peptidyl-prolyl cis-trans isomerase
MSDPKKRLFFVLAFLGLLVAALPAQPTGRNILDMTYPLDEAAIFWPTAKPFSLTKVAWGVSAGGWWYASNEFSASEHGGTHADAPIHFAEGGRTIDEVPLREWIGPAVRVDVRPQCGRDRDYLLTVDDLVGWERANGRIPEGSWVIMFTGIGTRYYPDKKMVLGTEKRGQEALPELSFPGFSPDSVEFLVRERRITGVAIDTPSIDRGKSADFKVHQILCAADKLALENIANLDRLPEKGATLYVIPMLMKGGTGGPARVFAVWDEGPDLNPRVRIRTALGDIEVEVYERKAPVTAANFLQYVDRGLFKGASFYRVVRPDNQPDNAVKIEVIQGGLRFSPGQNAFPPIEHETTARTGILHKDGVISMARSAPGSATSEFFICIGDQPELDFGGKRNPDGQGFAAFGRVAAGMDSVRKIQQLPDEGQILKEKVAILNVERIR